MTNPYNLDLDPNPANFVQMHPSSFLERAAEAWPNRVAVIHGDVRITYGEMYARCRRLASALQRRGIGPGDTVALMGSNTPEALEAHYAVPMIGAVVNPLNIRLDAPVLTFIFDHGAAKALITDTEFSRVIRAALDQANVKPMVIDVDDPQRPPDAGEGARLGETTYDDLLDEGDPTFDWPGVENEWDAVALSYTSGTTGNPKGVVTHARGAYVHALGNCVTWPLPHHPSYLWTLPMFHALGWSFLWSVTIMGGTHICLRKVVAQDIFKLIAEHGVTHMCGAPIVLSTLINAPDGERVPFDHTVKIFTAGSAPPPAVLKGVSRMGFDVTHVYGLTEVYGANTVCRPQEDWAGKTEDEIARLKARQGIAYPTLAGGMIVADPETCEPVPRDGETMGEILLRGHAIMKGYLKNAVASEAAFKGGWFHTGDLAVWHEDGYAEIKDRSKDIIISGGENISSIEVEAVLYDHPDVVEAAVVAKPHEKWGETPGAYVGLRPGAEVSEQDIITWCRDRLAHFKCPTSVVFMELPKTSTGKIQKFKLRTMA
ncbi:MAG: AMP-binding protein [Rhodospirillaceae bacterium]|nr:AMP-binding protein [Rhodospirillaceae bacterium]